jgi:hypothetical protein
MNYLTQMVGATLLGVVFLFILGMVLKESFKDRFTKEEKPTENDRFCDNECGRFFPIPREREAGYVSEGGRFCSETCRFGHERKLKTA